MRKNMRPTIPGWVLLIVLIVAVTVVALLFSPQPLPGYVDTSSGEPSSGTSSQITVDASVYRDETLGFSMEVPVGWNRVTKDGRATFIHAPSAASFQFQIFPYDPAVNMVTEESFREELGRAGLQFISFSKVSSSSYLDVYLKPGSEEGNGTVFIEISSWDRQNLVRVVGTLEEEYFDRMKDTAVYCLDSFRWEKKDPIPETVFLYYSAFGNFEFGVPAGWASGFAGNSFVAQNSETGAVMTVGAEDAPTSLSGISQLQYTDALSRGRSGFLLKTYQQQEGMLYGEAVFQSGNVQYVLLQYVIERGGFWYTLSYECPAAADASVADIFRQCTALFRTFQG